MRFKIIKNTQGQFRCQIVGNNGEVVWWTENYEDKRDAEKAIDLVYQVTTQGSTIPLDEVDEGEEAEKPLAPHNG